MKKKIEQFMASAYGLDSYKFSSLTPLILVGFIPLLIIFVNQFLDLELFSEDYGFIFMVIFGLLFVIDRQKLQKNSDDSSHEIDEEVVDSENSSTLIYLSLLSIAGGSALFSLYLILYFISFLFSIPDGILNFGYYSTCIVLAVKYLSKYYFGWSNLGSNNHGQLYIAPFEIIMLSWFIFSLFLPLFLEEYTLIEKIIYQFPLVVISLIIFTLFPWASYQIGASCTECGNKVPYLEYVKKSDGKMVDYNVKRKDGLDDERYNDRGYDVFYKYTFFCSDCQSNFYRTNTDQDEISGLSAFLESFSARHLFIGERDPDLWDKL